MQVNSTLGRKSAFPGRGTWLVPTSRFLWFLQQRFLLLLMFGGDRDGALEEAMSEPRHSGRQS